MGLVGIMLISISLLSACGNDFPAVGPDSTLVIAPKSNPGNSPVASYSDKEAEEMRQYFRNIMDEAKRRWQAKGITSYQITTSYKGGYFDETKIITITVKNNQVVTNTAIATPPVSYKGPTWKPGQYNTADYTVTGLFDTLRATIYEFNPQKNVFNVSFDPTYAFPNEIIFDYKYITDSKSETKVISFQVLS